MAHMHTIQKPTVTGPIIPRNTAKHQHTSGSAKPVSPVIQCSFRDVNIACTRWLMKNDPAYRAASDATREMIARREARRSGHAVPEDGTADTIRRNNFSSRV